MNKHWLLGTCSLCLLGFPLPGVGQETATSPRVTIRHPPGQSPVLEWPVSATEYTVEQAEALGPGVAWQPAGITPVRSGDVMQARIAATGTGRYFRLAAALQPPPGSTAFFLPDEPPTRGFEVEFDAAGRMHFVYVRHSLVREVQEVVYGTCEPGLDCDQPANWRTVVVHSGAIGTVQIEVTSDARPRLVIEDQYTVAGARLAYMACESNCLGTDGWRGIALIGNVQIGQVFALHLDQRWFAIDAAGRPRLLVSSNDGAFFLACDRDCTEPTGDWTNTALDTTGEPFLTSQLFAPVLRLDANGRPHLLGQSSRALVYLTAEGDFRQAENWRRVALTNPLQQGVTDTLPVAIQFANNLDLEIDRSGGVVVAFDGFVPGTQEMRAYLLRCRDGCAEMASWSGRPFSGTQLDSLDLVLDREGRPFLAFTGQVPQTGERVVQLATCTGGDCHAIEARWNARVLASSDTLERERPVKRFPETPALCSIPTTSWEFPSNRLLLHPSGTWRLVSNAAASSICQPGMDEWIDRWGTTRRGRTIDIWVIEARARWAAVR